MNEAQQATTNPEPDNHHRDTETQRYAKLAQLLREQADTFGSKQEISRADVSDVTELIRVLARLLEGKTIYKAFGAPGDWGYSNPIGKALAEAYRAKGGD